MPDIKTGEFTSDYRVPDRGITQKGVSKAVIRTPPSQGYNILAQVAGELKGATDDVANYYIKKAELLRQATSEEIQMNIADEFTERSKDWKSLKGTQAHGLLAEEGYHYGAYEELKAKYVTEGLDTRTRMEVQKRLDTAFLGERQALLGHTIKQAEVAHEQATKRQITNAHSFVNELDTSSPDYLNAIEVKAAELTKAHMLRRPDLNRAQVGKAYREDLLFHGMVKSFIESPIAATQLWENKKAYFKKHVPNEYDKLATKYESAKDDAQYDEADILLKAEFGEDYHGRANALAEDHEKYGLHADQALSLAAKYIGIHNANATDEKRVQAELEETTLDHLDETWRDPDTGLINLKGYLNDLEQAYRRGRVDKATRDFTRHWAMTGELSNEDFLEIEDEIDDGIIRNKMQIRQRLAGRSTNKLPLLYSHLDKVQADVKKGIDENQLNAAEQTFIRKAQADAQDNTIPDFLKHQAVDANAFKEQMRVWAKQMGYSSQDPRIHAEVVRLLNSSLGWYYKHPTVEEDMPFIEGRPGIMNYIGAIGTPEVKRITRWEYEAEHGRPEIKEEVQLKQDEETLEAVKALQDMGKVVNSSTVEQAKIILKQEKEASAIK